MSIRHKGFRRKHMGVSREGVRLLVGFLLNKNILAKPYRHFYKIEEGDAIIAVVQKSSVGALIKKQCIREKPGLRKFFLTKKGFGLALQRLHKSNLYLPHELST